MTYQPVPASETGFCFIFQHDWNKLCQRRFGGDVLAMARYVAGFGVVFPSGWAEWGTPAYPHPKAFAGAYKPTSPPFRLKDSTSGRVWTGRDFATAVKDFNSKCRIFPYVTPQVDNVMGQWDAAIGMPPPGPWYEGKWENLFHSMWYTVEQLGDENIDGFFFDMCASTHLTEKQYLDTIAWAKGFNKYAAPNCMFPYVSNAEFALKSPWMGNGDYLFFEGFLYDSGYWQGELREDTIKLAKYMSGKPVPLAATVEAPIGTLLPQMTVKPEADRWLEAYILWLTHLKQPGLMPVIQHTDYFYSHDPMLPEGSA